MKYNLYELSVINPFADNEIGEIVLVNISFRRKIRLNHYNITFSNACLIETTSSFFFLFFFYHYFNLVVSWRKMRIVGVFCQLSLSCRPTIKLQ